MRIESLNCFHANYPPPDNSPEAGYYIRWPYNPAFQAICEESANDLVISGPPCLQ